MRVQVTGVDGREWVVERRIEWRDVWRRDEPPTPPGRCAGAVTAAVVLVGLALVVRHVYPAVWNLLLGVPTGALVAVVLALLVVAGVRRVLGRPRSLVAEHHDEDPDGGASERWSGVVDGVAEGRSETAAILHCLRSRGTPARATSPLWPVT